MPLILLSVALALPSSAARDSPLSAALAWKRQPCGAFANGTADIVTQWGATIDPTKAQPLPEYPRPQLVRSSFGAAKSWLNMNGMWEWEPTTGINGTASTPPPFGKTLAKSILVPFPSESCLSGIAENHPYQWYRQTFDGATAFTGSQSVLHFGAVDWHAKIYLNKKLLGNHSGGYDGFSFMLPSGTVFAAENELVVFVWDPSEHWSQPFGKQRQASIAFPGTDGEKYTPSSGIWQTVWLEHVPSTFISDITITTDLTAVTMLVTASTASTLLRVYASVEDAPGHIVATATSSTGSEFSITIPKPKLWSPTSPFLYNVTISISDSQDLTADGGAVDTVQSYFGMRTISLGESGKKINGTATKALYLNGNPFFASGWLDQSFWPDGVYTAPTDEALAFDVQAVKTFGMNMVRMHQKINPDRWYYHADRLGVVVLQDMVQHFNYHNDSSGETRNIGIDTTEFEKEWGAAIVGRGNHPSIVQWNIFNEFEYQPGDWYGKDRCNSTWCPVLALTRSLARGRLVDFNSGGSGNDIGIGDVYDIHSYPKPATGKGCHGNHGNGCVHATGTRYGSVGEYGGIGWDTPGHEWLPGKCNRKPHYTKSSQGLKLLLSFLDLIAEGKAAGNVSSVVYTQITDVELECDGYFTYDRISHFNAEDTATIKAANLKLTAMDAE
jgi:hypothetical protein